MAGGGESICPELQIQLDVGEWQCFIKGEQIFSGLGPQSGISLHI